MRILFIGAHPDDFEYYCAGTFAKYAKQGHELYEAIATNGNIGSFVHETKEEIAAGGVLEGKAKAASILAKVGLIVGIVTTVIVVLYGIIYGIIMTFVTSAVIKKTLLSGKSLIQMTIMSDKHEEIREMIIHEMDAGVTMMMSEKGFTRQESKLITSVIPYNKLPMLKQKVIKIDPVAFIIVAKIEEVGGRGFTVDRYWNEM